MDILSIFHGEFNINNIIKKEQGETNIEQQPEVLELTYRIEPNLIMDRDMLPIINQDTFNMESYKNILETLTNILNDGILYELWFDKIIIKNTGSISIKLTDFYKNDKLGFKNSKSLIAAYINNKATKKYINANINIVDENFIEITFDEIEPDDSIELFVMSRQGINGLKLCGKTKDFEAPKKYNNYESSIKTQETKQMSKKMEIINIFFVILLIFTIGLSFFDLYLTHNKKELWIRNPFVIKEVINANK